MATIGDRLREERARLGLNQADFGAIGGVLKQAQINYEKGERSPDATYLAAVAAAGVDVAYVLTGQRVFVPPPPITAEQRQLIEDYEGSTPRDREALRRMAKAVSRQAPTAVPAAPRRRAAGGSK